MDLWTKEFIDLWFYTFSPLFAVFCVWIISLILSAGK